MKDAGQSGFSPIKFLRYALLGLIALTAALFLFLESIHHWMGHRIASGMHAPEISLCGLDRTGTVSILAAGDSRAKNQIIPEIIIGKTGRSCVNIGEDLPRGGDLTTQVNALRGDPVYLSNHPALLISVSMAQVNDYERFNFLTTALLNWRLSDHLRYALDRPEIYFKSLLPRLRHELLKAGENEFACSDEIHIPPILLASKGFRGWGAADTVAASFKEETAPFRQDYQLEGGNWSSFRAALDRLDESGARPIILFNAPQNPKWRRMFPDSELQANEAKFSRMMKSIMGRYANLHYLDFYERPQSILDSSYFQDRNHLNLRGSRLFSAILADTLMSLSPPRP